MATSPVTLYSPDIRAAARRVDPLRLAIAFVPLSAYLLLLGVLNLRRRPMLTSGASDFAALAIALTGIVFVGPMELFRPKPATDQMGVYIWLMLIGLYWLGVSLVALVSRPRLVVYNITLETLRPAVAEAVAQIDSEARWAGDNLILPRLGVQLHLDAFEATRNVSLVSSGSAQSLEGWARLKKALGRSLRVIEVRANPRSLSFLTAAALMYVASVAWLCLSPEQVAQGVVELCFD